MKKNFLKNLAGVLSLAMVVSSVAPATADAAKLKTLTLNRNSLVVYLQHEVYKNQFNLDVAKLADNAVTWTSSNKAVATVSKYGNVVGKKVGTAKITIKKAGYATKVVKVTVKDEAKSVKIANAPTDNTLKIGEKFDFNAKVVGKKGGASTDKTKWSVSDATMATITAGGVVTPLKAGKFEVIATAGKVTDKLEITVPITMTGAKQISINKVDVAFDSDVSKLVTKSNIAVETKDTKSNNYVKSVSFSADGKTVSLEVYNSFVDKKDYTVTYDKKSVEFTASVGDVAQVVVKDKTVKYAEPTDLDITLLDANGIDVTTATEMGKVTAKTTNNVGWVDYPSNGKIKVTLFNIGDVSTVTATYATGKFDTAGKSIDVVSNAATITAVKELAVAGNLQDFTAVRTGTSLDWSKPVKKIAKGDAGYVYFKGNVNGKDFDSAAVTGEEFESSNANILLVNKDGSYKAVAEGTAYVTGKYNNYTAVFAVEVGAERKATGISVDKPAFTLSKKFADSNTVKVTVKDQYGDDMAAQQVSVTELSKPNGGNLPTPDNTTTLGKVTFTTVASAPGVPGTVTGTYQYKLTLRDISVRVDVTVSDNGDSNVATYRIEQSNADFDLKADGSTTTTANVINVAQYNAAGVKLGMETALTTVVTVTRPNGTTVTGNSGTISIPLVTVAGNVVTKDAATGTYNVKVEVNGVVKQTGTFVVKDTQALPVVTIDTIKATNLPVTSGSSILNALNNAKAINAVLGADKFENAVAAGLNFTAVDCDSANGIVSSNGTVTTTTAGTYNVFLKSVTFTGTIGGNTITYVVDVKHMLSINVQ